LSQQLKQAITRLPQFTKAEAQPVREHPVPAFTPPPPDRHVTAGSFFVGDDRVIYQSLRSRARNNSDSRIFDGSLTS
jgi:hypothetical protein